MSTKGALVRVLPQEFGRPLRRRLTTSPTGDTDDTSRVDRAIEGLARRAFPSEDGFSLDVQKSPGRVRSVQILVSCEAFDGVCAVTTRMAGGGYRGADTVVAIDVRREASQHPLDTTPPPPRIPVIRQVVIISMFMFTLMGMVYWVFPGLSDAIVLVMIAALLGGLRLLRAREIQRTRGIDWQHAVTELAEQESRWQWFNEQVDAELDGFDLERKGLPPGPDVPA